MLLAVNLNCLNTSVTPAGVRARVAAGAYSTVNYGPRPIAALLGGLLATEIGLRGTLLIAAAGESRSILLASPIPRHRQLAATCRGQSSPNLASADNPIRNRDSADW